MKFYIPPQIPRLVIAFALLIFLFLVLRHFLVPDTFGKYGPYRAAAMDDYSLLEIHYSGQEACFKCHQVVADSLKADVHSEIHCETCHGPGQKHCETSALPDITRPTGREFCGRCHVLNAARQKDAVMQVDLKIHNIDKNCIECHNPHMPWEMKK
jgi:hypothetical protein